jgi:hypothetical protein
MPDIETWLDMLGLGKYQAVFAEHEVDAVPELSKELHATPSGIERMYLYCHFRLMPPVTQPG